MSKNTPTNPERWKQVDRLRRSLLPTNIRIISRSMVRAIEPFKQYLNDSRFQEQALMSVDLIDSEQIEKGYEELYVRTIPFFARRTFREIGAKEQKDVEDLWLETARDYIRSGVIADRIAGVTDTTKDRVRGIIQRGIDDGLSIPDIARDIDKLGLDQIIRNRSTVISRTETINASNKGSIEGARATGLELEKEWIATPGGRTRDDHADADGQRVPMNEYFSVGGEELEYPGDPNGSAEQIIQCRCSLGYVPI
jgi:hypothetical protein